MHLQDWVSNTPISFLLDLPGSHPPQRISQQKGKEDGFGGTACNTLADEYEEEEFPKKNNDLDNL